MKPKKCSFIFTTLWGIPPDSQTPEFFGCGLNGLWPKKVAWRVDIPLQFFTFGYGSTYNRFQFSTSCAVELHHAAMRATALAQRDMFAVYQQDIGVSPIVHNLDTRWYISLQRALVVPGSFWGEILRLSGMIAASTWLNQGTLPQQPRTQMTGCGGGLLLESATVIVISVCDWCPSQILESISSCEDGRSFMM